MIREVELLSAHIPNDRNGSGLGESTAEHQHDVANLLHSFDALRPAWDAFVNEHPKGSIFHTSQMVRVFQQAKRHSPLPLAALDEHGRLLALLVGVHVQTLPGPVRRLSSRSIMYAEPLCEGSPAGASALAELIAHHDRAMSGQILFTEVRPLQSPGCERQSLEENEYQFLDYLNYIVEVSKPLDTLWNELHKSARRKIRQCEKRGFEVRELRLADHLEALYTLLQQSYAHAGVPMADRSLFEAALSELSHREMVRLFAVFEGNTPLAMDLLLNFKERVYIWYGGLKRLPGVSPCAILRWHEIRWAHENGFTIYDTGGAGWPGVPYGVRDYKSIFGGELVRYGRYRKVFAPWTMAIAERAYNLRRKVLLQKRTAM